MTRTGRTARARSSRPVFGVFVCAAACVAAYAGATSLRDTSALAVPRPARLAAIEAAR